jgi:hypothetical protein
MPKVISLKFHNRNLKTLIIHLKNKKMKKIITMVLCAITIGTFAQQANKINISATTERTANEVTVTFWMEGAQGMDVQLGNSNFRIHATSNGHALNISNVAKNASVITAFDTNDSYEASSIGINEKRNLVSLNILKSNGANGAVLSTEKTVIGSIVVPVNSPTQTVELDWEVAYGDVTTYDYKALKLSQLNYQEILDVQPINLLSGLNSFEVSDVYPNPVVSSTNVLVNAINDGVATVKVWSIQGKLVSTTTTELTAGVNAISIDLSTANTGNYFVQVVSADGIASKSIVKN